VTPRQTFNLACQLQMDRVAAFLRPQSITKSLPSAPRISQAVHPAVSVGNERSAARQLQRTNRNPHYLVHWREDWQLTPEQLQKRQRNQKESAQRKARRHAQRARLAQAALALEAES
jgi:hypothetical protein